MEKILFLNEKDRNAQNHATKAEMPKTATLVVLLNTRTTAITTSNRSK